MTEATKRCPFCYEEIHEQAVKCRHCSAFLDESAPSFHSGSASKSHDEPIGLPEHIEEILGRKYEILEQLGEGGMGVVYKARQVSLNRLVAIKILSSSLSADTSFVKRFRREAQTIARLSHKNIFQIYDIEERHGIHLFIMEYVDGYTLEEFLKEKGRMSVHDSVQIIARAARAIEHAHRNNIIHRDIKPSNIMLDYHGHVKVMDFGLAKDTSVVVSQLTETGMIVGTLRYLSPEGCRGEQVDEKSDIYSLGVVLYEMLTGRPPFDSQNTMELLHEIVHESPADARSLNPNIPAGLNDILIRAMAKDKALRYESAFQFLEVLSKFRNGPGKKKDTSPEKRRRLKDALRPGKKKKKVLSERESEDEIFLREARRARAAKWGAYALKISLVIALVLVSRFLALYYAQSEKDKDLLVAVRDGQVDTVRRQLDRGADTNTRNKRGATSLIHASETGKTELVRLLLSRGADPNLQDAKGRTALMHAASKGHIDTVRLLLEEGADVNARDDKYWTPLLYATEKGYAEIAALLLSEDAQVNVETDYGDTPLMIAVNLGHTDILKALLEKGADPNVKTRYGWTALMRANQKDHADMIEILEEAGAKE